MFFYNLKPFDFLYDKLYFFTQFLKFGYFIFTNLQKFIIRSANFLVNYYKRNELLWVDGFIIDFLQKKSIDLFLRKFVIYTGFIFSERLVFEYVVRFYLDNLVWPIHYMSLLDFSNVREILSLVVFFYFIIFSIIFLLFIVLY